MTEAFANQDVHGSVPAFAVQFGSSIIQIDEATLTQPILTAILQTQSKRKQNDARVAVQHSISKRQTKTQAQAAKRDAIRRQAEARRLQAEQEAADLEHAALLELESEEQNEDAASLASFLSAARTAASGVSSTGMSGYTEDLAGFAASETDSSYVPSEAVSSVAREPAVLRSTSAAADSGPSLARRAVNGAASLAGSVLGSAAVGAVAGAGGKIAGTAARAALLG